jgi:hypothetical protein
VYQPIPPYKRERSGVADVHASVVAWAHLKRKSLVLV